jgi:peptidoglycan/xylan/chitin deacetylase (PgdA/CDA1 family)
VETISGRDHCAALMDIDDSFGMKSSFQVIPEQRYSVSPKFLDSIRRRGFEVVVHDLNHDGHLYRDRKQFVERATKINAYGREYGARGFRAGSLYRKQLWYDALEFEYDMSVPNVAHLDPQRGGCCTVMPYFLGNILELPVTTTQDYTLFNILEDNSLALWKRQIEIILQKHGLMSFIAHPDYLTKSSRRNVYKALLRLLTGLRKQKGVWITTPGEVSRWWRQRAQMKLVEDGDGWRIEGEGKDRAQLAYAMEERGGLVLTLQAGLKRKLALRPLADGATLSVSNTI